MPCPEALGYTLGKSFERGTFAKASSRPKDGEWILQLLCSRSYLGMTVQCYQSRFMEPVSILIHLQNKYYYHTFIIRGVICW